MEGSRRSVVGQGSSVTQPVPGARQAGAPHRVRRFRPTLPVSDATAAGPAADAALARPGACRWVAEDAP
ncbi:Hypothetical protein I596_474 [Dokdonella koreensis DS-123]|uniref:Uncharacterized protein n=1 Tax=Dokdonella koreensis DS-123 TaxID=1300342 RepID=A0A167GFV5_9GAMM|nr:Hypothetical protein I596_474 [Dokdonella koreensis DS-123]